MPIDNNQNKVVASKDFKHFRRVESPVAGIANNFYKFLTSDSIQASQARLCYSTAYLGREPKEYESLEEFVGSELDKSVRESFSKRPQIVLAQGPMHPWGLFVKKDADGNSIDSASVASTPSVGLTMDPYDGIFLPWTIHQHLKDAIDGDDQDELPYAAFFALACIVHETAHWLALSRHGYIHDRNRDSDKAEDLAVNLSKAEITIHSRDDWGTHAKEMLLGGAFQYVTYADGVNEVVFQRILPALPSLPPPVLTPQLILSIISVKPPRMTDITRYGNYTAIREVPQWRKDSGYLLVSSISPDAACHHGACRKRSAKR